MKRTLFNLTFVMLTALPFLQVAAQDTDGKPGRIYSMSGAGFAFPIGEAADYLKPKFSTSLGLNIGLGSGGLFLYPKVSLHAYGYQELETDAGYNYRLQKGRATTYLLNMALGYRKMAGKFAFYGFAGGGGGMIITPRIAVNQTVLTAELDNKSNGMGMIEAGTGLEYHMRTSAFFLEASYMHGFSKLQHRNFAAVPITIGIKPNLNNILGNK